MCCVHTLEGSLCDGFESLRDDCPTFYSMKCISSLANTRLRKASLLYELMQILRQSLICCRNKADNAIRLGSMDDVKSLVKAFCKP